MSEKETQNTYTGEDIKVLDDVDAIRKYPGMYIGSTDEPNHLLYEIIDNSVDEHIMGHCSDLTVHIIADDNIRISDNGRGIPIDKHVGANKATCELVFVKIHSGGKFDANVYEKSGGLHGVGLVAVNALSEEMEVIIHRDGQKCRVMFKRGKKESIRKETLKTNIDRIGTEIRIKPDKQIFDTVKFDIPSLMSRLQNIAMLKNSLKIKVINDMLKTEEFIPNVTIEEYFENSLCSQKLNHEDTVIIQEHNDVGVNLVLNWQKGTKDEKVLSFTNSIPQRDGGYHVIGVRNGIIKFLSELDNIKNLVEDKHLVWADVKAGFRLIITIDYQHPKFDSQEKNRLVSGEVKKAVEFIVYTTLKERFSKDHKFFAKIIHNVIEVLLVKNTKKDGLDISAFMHNGRLVDCKKKEGDIELFIVEGESAGGSIKQCRNRDTQAILSLRGKILNVEKANIKQIINSETLVIIASAIGGKYIGEGIVEIERIKYERIIILVDADVDGGHIRALLLTLFYRHMKAVIDEGKLFVAVPPLYRAQTKKGAAYIGKQEELLEYMADTIVSKRISKEIKPQEEKKKVYDLIKTTINIMSEEEALKDEKSVFLIDLCLKYNKSEKYDVLQDTQVLQKEFRSEFPYATVYKDGDGFVVVEDHKTLSKTILDIQKHTKISQIARTIQSFPVDLLRKHFGITDKQFVFSEMKKDIDKFNQDVIVQRFKGLGEMNADQLFETTMDPKKRVLKRIAVEDAEEAERTCIVLMGDETDHRKQFIMDHYESKL